MDIMVEQVDYLGYLAERYKSVQSSLSMIDDFLAEGKLYSGINEFDDLTAGFFRGEWIEISGETDSGKTALALTVASYVQQNDGIVVYCDLEGKFDSVFASRMGVLLDKLIIIETTDIQQLSLICEVLIRRNVVDLLILDSVTLLSSQAYNILSRFYHTVRQSYCSVIFTSQLRGRLESDFFPSCYSAAPDFLKARAGVRLSLKCVGMIYKGLDVIGRDVEITLFKNIYSLVKKSIVLQFYYDSGFKNKTG